MKAAFSRLKKGPPICCAYETHADSGDSELNPKSAPSMLQGHRFSARQQRSCMLFNSVVESKGPFGPCALPLRMPLGTLCLVVEQPDLT